MLVHSSISPSVTKLNVDCEVRSSPSFSLSVHHRSLHGDLSSRCGISLSRSISFVQRDLLGQRFHCPSTYVSLSLPGLVVQWGLSSGTGTGKTLAFTLPIVERLQRDLVTERGRSPRCLVLEPTRELAKQVTDDFLSIKNRLLSISTLYGGKDYAGQESSLRQGSDVVVGTPGRIKDFLLRKKLLLHRCEILVLDEVDRMLDMGFQVRSVLVVAHLQWIDLCRRTMLMRSFVKCPMERRRDK